MPVSTDSLQSIDDQLTQRTDILIQILLIHDSGNFSSAQHLTFFLWKTVGHIKILGTNSTCLLTQFIFDLLRLFQKLHMDFCIKVYIRQGRKQAIFDKRNHIFIQFFSLIQQLFSITADAL